MQQYVASSLLPVSVEEAFAYHERPGALMRLVPPWQTVQIEQSDGSLSVGSQVILRTKVASVPVRWIAVHTEYDPPHLFADTQLKGPFAVWNHRHEFASEGNGSRLTDRIEYQLPMGAMGDLFGGRHARSTIESMFAYRHRVTRDDLQLQADHSRAPMQVAISGSTGLVGSQLAALLTLLGHRVRPLVRSMSDDDQAIAAWQGVSEAEKLGQVDAVVHLAGKSIAAERWNDRVKAEIRDSRVNLTRQLCESLARLSKRPAVLVCASATGIYGDRGKEILDERSAPGSGFLADVAQQWEEACRPAIDAGIRVVHARLGVVLSPRGGALQKMLTPAKFCGGALGSGNQWWSWIGLDDVLGAINHCLHDPSISGPVNFVSPQPLTNRDFAKTLGAVLRRPAMFPAPAIALRMALGEMADSLLLASARVTPQRLVDSGYRFRFTDLEELLRYSLGHTLRPQ